MALTAPEREPEVDPAVSRKRRGAVSVEEAFEVFDAAAPEGWRVELVEGDIRVTPPANGEHEEIVAEIVEQVRDHRKEFRSYTGVGLLLPGGPPGDKVVPDLVVAPKGTFANEQEYHAPTDIVLVGEVTSRSTGDRDRKAKLHSYARAGIPHYLLIDRDANSATLFSKPDGKTYSRQVVVALSNKLELPDPLGFVLDTSEF
jgi:Uma2 family endonuclease